MLMLDNTAGCARLLDKQLSYCEQALGADHPLAAKMLAVMARLQVCHATRAPPSRPRAACSDLRIPR